MIRNAERDLTKLDGFTQVMYIIADNTLVSEFDRLNLWKYWRAREWAKLLQSQPQFADKCDKYKHNGWERFKSEWIEILSAQPQLADKCDEYNGWEKFKSSDWIHLLNA